MGFSGRPDAPEDAMAQAAEMAAAGMAGGRIPDNQVPEDAFSQRYIFKGGVPLSHVLEILAAAEAGYNPSDAARSVLGGTE